VIFILRQLCVFELKEFIIPLSCDEQVPIDGKYKSKEFADVSKHDHDITVERKLQAHKLYVGISQFI
jgi:hypothetical protein